ncbi:hypothetical protein [Leeuwenhoekiella marinoflava]|uniref:hypothetical protein n=1 Tax=Leeuwenhoekiella marinoflava TaxID=988 RepID=UPI0030018A15
MKRFLILTIVVITCIYTSCESTDENLPSINLKASELNFTVTQNPEKDNEINLKTEETSSIPYWSYFNENGDQVGYSNKVQLMVNMPFAGVYDFYYTAFTKGGAVEADLVQVTVSNNDEDYFSAEEWQLLTNGVAGKTWVLNMVNPLGYGGTDFPYNPDGSNYWNWYPDYAGNEWLMENKDWGEMTFDLDGAYNVEVTQTTLNSTSQTTKSGSFNYDIENHKINLNNGVELLFGGDFYPDISNWSSVEVIELSENAMRLAVLRDQSRTGEDNAKLIFHYKPKQ